ncbi:MAG TPA: VWA domain-containing protein [Bryobacteraceae bacterium]|nr:VWA domain-containing protein [Bryobacteraceae bacterium]
MRSALFVACAVWGTALLPTIQAGDDFVFKSEVSLVRVDAQVVDKNNRAITGLSAADFVLREEGVPRDIRNFAQEDMPVDVLLLLDVSGSMQPHIQRIASASHQALQVLGDSDRVAVMVFDRAARLRMPFRSSRADVERELDAVLSEETFDGGTDVTRGLMEAARYVQANGRREARRAIVILTDDQSERGSDPKGVIRALTRADAVLSLLLAPDALGSGSRGVSFPRRGGLGGPLGGIILGRRMPGPVIIGPHTRSAGTEEIARESGGDSLRVDEASALERTLSRLRQRYALHFHLPEGAQPGAERTIEVALADEAQRRYPGAEVHFRRTYMAPGGPNEPIAVAQEGGLQRRDGATAAGETDSGGWRRTGEQAASVEHPPAAPPTPPNEPQGGWRRVDPEGAPGWRRVGDHPVPPRTQ